MQRDFLLVQKAGIGRVANQRVLELVRQRRRVPSFCHETAAHEPSQLVVQVCLGTVRDMRKHRIGKLAPNHGANLGDFLRGPQPVEARHQGVLQRIRDFEVARRRSQRIELLQFGHLDDVLGQVFDEQRQPVGPFGDRGHRAAGDGMPATEPIDHRQRIVAIEHQKSHLRNIQPVPPVVGMLGPCGNEGKHRQVRGGVHHHSQQFVSGRVDPVEILDDQENRASCRRTFHQVDEHFQQTLTLPLRRQPERSVRRLVGNRQQRCQ